MICLDIYLFGVNCCDIYYVLRLRSHVLCEIMNYNNFRWGLFILREMEELSQDYQKLLKAHRKLITTFFFYRLAFRLNKQRNKKVSIPKKDDECSYVLLAILFMVMLILLGLVIFTAGYLLFNNKLI